jgi:Mlc titration factor MtfA (ptsG expression regulator)
MARMVFGWFKKRRRQRVIAAPFPEAWVRILEQDFAHWQYLDDDERSRLEHVIQVLIAEKTWEGCGGLQMTDEIRVCIAAQAALLLLEIDHDYYRNVDSILVYPSGYVLPRATSIGGGAVAEEQVPVLGSARLGGPVILAWDSVREGGRNARDGRNVVYHEFAHKLDMLDGMVDGTPELADDEEFQAWVSVMTREYDELCEDARNGRKSLLDKYGATNVGEFFAVATEAFFEKPTQMKEGHPALYQVLQDFYGQDPAERLALVRT